MADTRLQTLQPLFNKLDYSPSVYSGTVLCFTKATSPAPSAKHLVNINPTTKMCYKAQLPCTGHCQLRAACCIPSATDQ